MLRSSPAGLDAVALGPVALGPEALDPDRLLTTFGLLGLLAIVFTESGLLVGFFLPGDSLLFTAGLLSSTGVLDVPIWLLVLLVPLAAIAGDQVGYAIGRKAGPAVFRRPDSRFFREEYVDKAYGYFERYGARTIVVARFVPIVRTFAPVVAGVAGMRYRTFVAFNILGGILWGAGVLVLGYLLGGVGFVRDNVEVILLGIVALSVLPIGVEFVRTRRTRRIRRAGRARRGPRDHSPKADASRS
jgi:membrane-associated protein